ncbi:MAG TPA: asparagine synthase (glutamine-hydrolyzing) [Acidimicrobiales bacterium]|nr:asparagine synthase (glutamine-hydrolyzing) [Acidimicrobiales bacterium]
MCGITGVFEYGCAVGSVTEALLASMRDSLAHRGPDDAGLYLSEDRRLGLGHRRLSIVDLDHGAQPMEGRGGVQLVFNGEIYNYPRLRAELESSGARFRTHCDTEVILHLYERHGLRCLDRLVGMFAFALWDPGPRRLLLARDPVGEKPLYWADIGGRLVFGSEIKALLCHPSVPREVNTGMLGPFLANLVAPGAETLYQGIHKLRPGTFATCDERGVQVSRYSAGLPPRRLEHPSFDDAVMKVRSLLETSVHDRLMSDVPVGVLLSGGVDSAALVGLLHERAAATSSFTVGFPGTNGFDERSEAREIAARFGTDHHEVALDERAAIGLLPELVHHADEPLADPVCIPLTAVTALARDHGVKVVLAGEGADEVFWGYNGYLGAYKRWARTRLLLSIPGPLLQLLATAAARSGRSRRSEHLGAVARGRPGPVHFPVGMTRAQRRGTLGALGADPGWEPSDGRGDDDPLATMMFDTQEYELDVRLPELLLMRIDRFSMAHGVEARVPFLDPELIKFAYGLPLEVKLRGMTTKALLKAAVSDLLPSSVLDRPKTGFGAPTSAWFRSRHGDLLAELVSGEVRRYFNASYLDTLSRSLDPTSWEVGQILWPVLMFALWHRYWIEGEAIEDVLASAAA